MRPIVRISDLACNRSSIFFYELGIIVLLIVSVRWLKPKVCIHLRCCHSEIFPEWQLRVDPGHSRLCGPFTLRDRPESALPEQCRLIGLDIMTFMYFPRCFAGVDGGDRGHHRVRASGPGADACRAGTRGRGPGALSRPARRPLRHDEGGLVDRWPPLVGDVKSGVGQCRDKRVEGEDLDHGGHEAQTPP